MLKRRSLPDRLFYYVWCVCGVLLFNFSFYISCLPYTHYIYKYIYLFTFIYIFVFFLLFCVRSHWLLLSFHNNAYYFSLSFEHGLERILVFFLHPSRTEHINIEVFFFFFHILWCRSSAVSEKFSSFLLP